MTFYNKFIKSNRWGFPLRGGSFTKWRLKLEAELYKKRIDIGPEPERPRSVWSNWFALFSLCINNLKFFT